MRAEVDSSTSGRQFKILQNVPLAPFTTLGVGGPAQWFATAWTEDQVGEAAQFASSRGLRLFVLGGGSNLLVSDAGFSGLVLRIAMDGMVFHAASKFAKVLVDVAAGENWDAFVQSAVERDLAGIECLAGIPGTVGGTPVQNVGAYGQEVSQAIRRVRCFDLTTGSFVEMENAACAFAYRTSLFNTSEHGRYIVTNVQFELQEHGSPNLTYADLQRRFVKSLPSLTETADAVRTIRRGKGMVVDPAEQDSRSAGSFFKNPIVERSILKQVAEAAGLDTFAVPHWPMGASCIKLPAAWLLERAGFERGYSLGNAGISSKHTLALINRGGATESNIAQLRDRIIAGVRDRFGVQLEQEPVNVR